MIHRPVYFAGIFSYQPPEPYAGGGDYGKLMSMTLRGLVVVSYMWFFRVFLPLPSEESKCSTYQQGCFPRWLPAQTHPLSGLDLSRAHQVQ